MLLTITTPDRIFTESRQIGGVYVETDGGPLSILNHHAALMTTSKLGNLRVYGGEDTDTYLLRNAIIQMDNSANHLSISCLDITPLESLQELNLGNYLEYLAEELAKSDLDSNSLQYQFLAGEKIAVEKQLKRQ